jgi:ATP-binding cassette, subfamily B, bacterial
MNWCALIDRHSRCGYHSVDRRWQRSCKPVSGQVLIGDQDLAQPGRRMRWNSSSSFQALPGGLQHVLGDRGMGLSGGQRQRLAIARALYRDPRLLIFDEATSALDQESEHLIKQALTVLCRGRTTLIIAHRLSIVRDADRIVVLDDGHVAESGTFDELMALNGHFSRLAKEQLS